MTAAGIEPANIQFVAQRLNHCATAVPNDDDDDDNNNNNNRNLIRFFSNIVHAQSP